MDKKEFLEKLTMALAGQVSRSVIEENIRYYENYITEETRKGNSLHQVLEALGDPRLIAKSIIDANGGGSDMAGVYEDSDSGDHGTTPFREQEESRDSRFGGGFHGFHLSGFWAILLILVIITCVLMIVGTIIGGIFMLIRPILVPLLLFCLLYSLIKRR